MRILFVSNIFPNPLHPTKGTFNFELLRGLSREHAISVISPISWIEELSLRGKPLSHDQRQGSVDGIRTYYPRYYYTPRIGRRFYGEFYWHSIKRVALRVAREQRPDLVLSYWAHPDGEAATRLARVLDVSSVVMVGGSDILLFTSDRMRRSLIVKSLLDADRIITVGHHLRRSMEALDVPSHRISVIYRGVDRTRFSPGSKAEARRALGIPEGIPVAVWAGRMVPVKGLDTLLQAAARLNNSGTRLRFYLLGDGPLRETLEADAARRALGEVVSFVGPVAHRDLPLWYRAADVTALPSLSEGVPNVLLESIACGTPFVASAVGGIPEIVDTAFDRLVAPGDATALAEALAIVARRQTTAFARRFTPRDAQAVSAEFSAALHSACAHRRPPVMAAPSPVLQVH